MSKLREAFLIEAVGLINHNELGRYSTGSELTFYLPDIKKVVRLKLDYRPMDLIKTENGKESKYVGSAYGVILSSEDNNAHYEERLCDDGETRTFLSENLIKKFSFVSAIVPEVITFPSVSVTRENPLFKISLYE